MLGEKILRSVRVPQTYLMRLQNSCLVESKCLLASKLVKYAHTGKHPSNVVYKKRCRHMCVHAERNVTWLILPVVICLSQRLSHACLSINNYTVKLRMAH